MDKYKEAIERLLDDMQYVKPNLKNDRRKSRMASLLSLVIGVFILIILARLYGGGLSEAFEGSYIIFACILVVLIWISELVIRNYALKK